MISQEYEQQRIEKEEKLLAESSDDDPDGDAE
jgi:hypothetical protein